jgi:N-acetylglucosaminyldiphosphoundecaprenol N-acetyl-beta-D-mannosaminyltransferase
MPKNSELHQKYVTILGIKILSTTGQSLLGRIHEKIVKKEKFYIVTPNPELVLASIKNNKLKIALNSADFSVPDGIGLSQAAKFLTFGATNPLITFFQGLHVGLMTIFDKKYVTDYLPVHKGREVFNDLINLASKKGYAIYLLGGMGNEALITASVLKQKYPELKIFSAKGPELNGQGVAVSEVDKRLHLDVLRDINIQKPDLLFVAFGNPKQELWISRNIGKLKIRGAMTVGGTLRYVSGLTPLPPIWMEGWGEWFWRLLTEPYRIKRIFNAAIIFPIKVFWSKLQSSS